MKHVFRSLALFALPLLTLGTVRADLNPAFVAADARWVVYADLNALRASTLGKELIDAVQKMQFQATGGAIALDVQKLLATVGTLTAYGANLSADPKAIDGALVVQGTADLRKIAESLLLQATIAQPKMFLELTDLPFPAYAIASKPNAGSGDGDVVIAFPPEPVVLVSKSRAQLIRARDVVRGSAASLAKTHSSPLTKLLHGAPNSYLFAASIVPSEKIFPDNAPQARVLQMASSGSVAFGEKGADTFAHAELSASSEAMAEKLKKILEGMAAMLSLAESTDKQLTEFLNSTKVAKNKEIVTLDLAYSSARLVQMVQSLQQTAKPQESRGTRPTPPIASGRTLAEWNAAESTEADSAATNALASRTIENVELKNGATITLGWRLNGGKGVRYNRVEIAPAQGGMPLVFRPDMMRAGGGKGNFTAQFQFPGADGTYTLKVAYANDPEGKATYAVSVKEPAPRAMETETKLK